MSYEETPTININWRNENGLNWKADKSNKYSCIYKQLNSMNFSSLFQSLDVLTV